MKRLCSLSEIEELTKQNKIVLLYFSATACNPCKVIMGKVEKILQEYPKVESCEVVGEMNLDISAKFGIFSFPILLLFVENKETLRIGRNIDFKEFHGNLNRYYQLIF
ncbi:MAG: thioredoxin family protein [Clostridium sp.]